MNRLWWRVCRRFLLLILFVATTGGHITGLVMGGRSLNAWMMSAPYFDIIDIAVHDNDMIATEELLAISGLSIGENIFKSDLSLAHARMKDDPRLDDIFLRREYPNGIAIHVVEKKPVAYLQLDRIYGVNEDSEIIPISMGKRLPDLPIVTGCRDITPDRAGFPEDRVAVSFDDEHMSLIQAIYIIEKIKAYSPDILDRISEVHMAKPDDPVLFMTGDGLAIRLGTGRLTDKLSRLNKMLQKLKRDGIKTPTIDLRFKDQVIIQPITSGHQPETQS